MQFKTYFRKIYLTFFFIILFLTNAISLENKIVFKIENEIITNLDIDNERKYLEALNPDIKDLGENRINSIAKNSLIKEKIKKNEILKFNKQINLDPKFLERLIRDRYSRLNLNNNRSSMIPPLLSHMQVYCTSPTLNVPTLLVVIFSRNISESLPKTKSWPIWLTSNKPALDLTASCSSVILPKCIGI